jgi:murein DD-endopeptidase MepM/ murein hydrolase activator NlpD
MRDGQFSNYGAILGASLDVDGHTVQAFRFTDPASGKAAYYDENGRSLQRFFLKSPLKFEPRITSRFSRSRLHPIDNVYKAHLGVDYGAPAGSSVVAVAAGTVVSAGYSGAGGNMVHLRHAGGFETFYLHLSSFGLGVRAGAHVAQGQLVGRVGMTGSATGPHLDYRLKRNGVFVNPVSFHARQAPGEPIAAAQLAAFSAARDQALSRLSVTLLAAAPRQKPDAVRATR